MDDVYRGKVLAIVDYVERNDLILTPAMEADLKRRATLTQGVEKLELLRRIANQHAYRSEAEEMRAAAVQMRDYAKTIGNMRFEGIADAFDGFASSVEGAYEESVVQLTAVEAAYPDDWAVLVYASLFRSVSDVRFGRYTKAYKQLQLGLGSIPPSNADPLAPAMRYEFLEAVRYVEMKLGAGEAAIDTVERALTQAEFAGLPANGFNAIYSVAFSAAELGDVELALEIYTRLNTLLQAKGVEAPRLFVLRELSKAYFETGQYEMVITIYNEAKLIDENVVSRLTELRILAARAYARVGETAIAAQELAALWDWIGERPDMKGTENEIRLTLVEADIASSEGDFTTAFARERLYRERSEEILREQFSSSVGELRGSLQVELEQERARLVLLEKERKLAEAAAQSRQWVAILAFILFGGALAVAAYQRWIARQMEKNRRKAQAANRAKSEFLATMSHELRTPMNGVLGMAQSLREMRLSTDAEKCVDVILDSGKSLMALLNDILDLSKIEAGRLEIARTPEDIGAAVRKLIALWEPKANEKGLRFTLAIQDDLRLFVFDPVRVRQCVANLISNAVKFTEKGGIAIDISSAVQSDGSHLIKIKVSDTGLGMTDETMRLLFSPFTQADASITRKFGGTGLGLSITRRLARLMGGDLTVQSTAGMGSTFQLSFKAVPAAHDLVEPSNDAAKPNKDILGLKTLVVEDNNVNQMVLEQFLKNWNHEIVIAEHGGLALDKLREETFDLVLMDLQMPVIDGLTATKLIRRSGQAWADIPIVALTAEAMSGDADKCYGAGMDAYTTKPIEVGALQRSIEEALRRRKKALTSAA